MKKIILLAMAMPLTLSLIACGGSYRKVQTAEETMLPFNCSGLHMKNAQWHFTDEFGQQIDATGACHAGRKHGQFNFYMKGTMVAKTKFVKDSEAKTTCVIAGKDERSTLQQCMQKHANLNAQ